MPDALLEGTALPNLHPALVHLPIALAAAALLFDLAGLALGRGAAKARPRGLLAGHRLALEGGLPVYPSLHGPQLEMRCRRMADWSLTY